MSDVYTVQTLADRWQCGKDTVLRLLRSGELRGFKLGGKLWRIRSEDVAAWENTGADTASGHTGSGNSKAKPSSLGPTNAGHTAEDWVSRLPR